MGRAFFLTLNIFPPFPWCNSPLWTSASHFPGFTITIRQTTVDKTSDERPAGRRDLYLTSHNTYKVHLHPCPRRDSNPQSQQASSSRPRLRQYSHWDRVLPLHTPKYYAVRELRILFMPNKVISITGC